MGASEETVMYILGVWDGHDSGAAIIKDDRVLVALNEERLTRRKLEIRFPVHSIQGCLNYLGLSPSHVPHIAVSTYDFSKTLTRIFPHLKEDYYFLRRRKKSPGRTGGLKKALKCALTEWGPNVLSKGVSASVLKSLFTRLGFRDSQFHLVDHHLCHAAAAAFCSGFKDCLVITMDGVGDGLSATLSSFTHGKILKRASISGKHSLGIFFEHVTNLLNMRELEDEGKVMALAQYAYPVPDPENPLLDLIRVDGLDVLCEYPSLQMRQRLKEILFRYPSEQFAHMAQRTLEVKILELARNGISATSHHCVTLAGGVFSNIRVNRLIRTLPEVEQCFVFPHMGDGGLAAGAALSVNNQLFGRHCCCLEDAFLGPEYSDAELKAALNAGGLNYERRDDIEERTAKIISQGHIVFWFQGRMEYGPRALGHRSILALPNSKKIKDTLNLKLKMRVWYQPFCPTMLEEDAKICLEDYAPNPFMTMGHMVREDKRDDLEGVTGVDGSCRPQIIKTDGSRYGKLLAGVKKITGRGVILNTSFNIHGEPMVCSPADAVDTFKRAKGEYLAMGDYLVSKI